MTAALAASLAACGGGDGGGGAPSSMPLAGMVGGKPWMFVAGETDFFLSSNDPDNYFTTFYDVPATPSCTPGGPTAAQNQLIVLIPKKTGSYARGGTFVYPDSMGRPYNDVTLTGSLEVTSISATQIVGGVKMAIDAKNTVDGQFTVDICAQ